MISRRNIRVYVFQTIYELGQQMDNISIALAKKALDAKFNESSSLLAAVSHLLFQICDYVLIHANQKASKFIATKEDLNINTKLAGNLLIEQLKKNQSFTEVVKKHHLAGIFDDEFLKKAFQQLLDSAEYDSYLNQPEHELASDKSILLFILKKCIFDNEAVVNFLSEKYLGWHNDAEMVEATIEKMIVNPASFQFNKLVTNDKLEFAYELLEAYYEKKEYVFSLIEPKLVNWDAERVAIIDLILLHLGICEMLYFPTIPIKVSINEYIDLAKAFSTLQSGQFVNGLLDNVHKELLKDNKLQKKIFTK